MSKLSIIGKGNVGTHLYKAFSEACFDVQLVNSRTQEGLWADADVYFLCVKDDALEDVCGVLSVESGVLSNESAVVVHTAGTKPMSLLEGRFKHYGVFYPMQTFTKGKSLCYRDIPVFLEADSEETMTVLKGIAEKVFERVSVLSSEQRKVLHVAAVFTSNFTNHMLTLADRQLQEIGLDYTVMLPLLDEVCSKLHQLHPTAAQTGPAVRGDQTVINAHLAQINDETTKQIYTLLSRSILNSK